MPVVHRTATCRELAEELTQHLMRSLDPTLVGLVQQMLANQDWDRCGNLREFWFRCYDEVQTRQRQSFPTS
jgi:hypothetical protein